MKKILLSLSSIAAVAAIVAVGSTGAWWSDTAESSDNTFNSGSMDLELKGCDDDGNNCDNWRNDVTETWDYENMYPGGDKEGSNLLLRNAGDTPADWLKFDTTAESSNKDNENNDKAMSNVMRITEFSYAGENLLEDGAGADLGKYEGPKVEDCDVIVDGEGDNDEYRYIQNAIDNGAEDGDLICVRNGDYNESVEINKEDITLATLNGPDEVNLEGGIDIESDGVTVRGFEIDNDDGESTIDVTSEDVTIESNIMTNSLRGLRFDFAEADVSDIEIVNNRFETDNGVAQTEDTSEMLIKGNTFNTKIEGIGVGDGASDMTIKENLFDGSNDPEDGAIKVYDTGSSDVDNLDIHYNDFENFEEAVIINEQGITVNARYNWWGQATGAEDEQTEGDVNTKKHLGGPHVGFVNGKDHNKNGFADLYDLHQETVVTEEPQLEEGNKKLYLETQLDGPTATNEHQGESVDLDMEITMGQGPVNQ